MNNLMSLEKNLDEVLNREPDEIHPDDLLELYGMWVVDEMGKKGWIDLHRRVQNSAERRYVKKAMDMGLLQSYTDSEIIAAVTWGMHCLGIEVKSKNVQKLYNDLRG